MHHTADATQLWRNFRLVRWGVEAIKLAIAECDDPLRIPICGDDAIRLGLALSERARREIIIVTSGIMSDSSALAEYARRVG